MALQDSTCIGGLAELPEIVEMPLMESDMRIEEGVVIWGFRLMKRI